MNQEQFIGLLQDERRLALDDWRQALHAALQDDYRHPIYPALHDTIDRHGIPLRYLEDVLDGVGMDLNVAEYHTLASLGIPMKVIGINARLLRDMAGNDMSYTTNSITLGGGESLDVILDAGDTSQYPAGRKFYLYTPNLDRLSNDAENFGGMMTEINICNSVNPVTKACG